MGAKSGPNPSLDRNSQCGYHRHLALVSGNRNLRELSSQTDLDLAIWRILFPGWRAMLTPLQRELALTQLKETRSLFLETGRTLHGLRGNLLFLYQPIRILRGNLAMVRETSKKGEKRDMDQIIGIGLCKPGPHG